MGFLSPLKNKNTRQVKKWQGRNGIDGEWMVLIFNLVSSIVNEQSQQRRGMGVQGGKGMTDAFSIVIYQDISSCSSFPLKLTENTQF